MVISISLKSVGKMTVTKKAGVFRLSRGVKRQERGESDQLGRDKKNRQLGLPV